SIVPNAEQKAVFANPYGNEPLKFNKTDVKSTVLLPTLGGYTRIKGLSVGGGVYVPMGYSSKWEDTVGTLTGTYEMEAYETIYDISVAKELIPNLSLGVSLNLISGRLAKHAKKTYGYEYTIDFKGDGTGFEGVIGGLYKIQPNLSVGFVYRTGSKITFDGSAKRIHTAAPSFNHQTDYEQVFRHPATLGLGIAYKPTNKLTLTTDWNQTDWSSQKDEITYTTQGTTPPFVNTNNESGWKDTNKIRLGGEYKLNTAWTLRAGFLTDPSPVPDKAVSLTNLIDLDRTFQTIGAGYSYGNWQFDFGCLHTKTDKTIDGVKYERSSDSINVASSYRF
ncbi:outer membrane protein transport protein, partial [Candidatus Desantisbacteria bacterium]|nr:outer membrane protein transport protein [Candidatus Desantisbacteria bacterium]